MAYRNNKTILSKKPRNPKKKVSKQNNNQLVVLTDVGRFAPDRLKVRLIYNDGVTSRTHAASNAMNFAFRSSAYDPDPGLLTGAIPGFVELANMYAQYLVHQIDTRMEIINQDTAAYIIGCWPSNVVQNVNSLTSSDIQEYSSNVHGSRHILPPVTGGPMRVQLRAVGTELFGRQFLTDEDFSGSTSGNPSTMYGVNIGIFRGDGSNMGFPVIVSTVNVYHIEFFGLRQLES